MFSSDITKIVSANGILAITGGFTERLDLILGLLVKAGQFGVAVITIVYIWKKIQKSKEAKKIESSED